MLQSLWLTCALAFSSFAFALLQTPDTTAQFQQAVALQQQGKLNEAAAAYRTLLKTKPDYVEALANLGVVLSRLGQYAEAITAYEKAFKLNPQLTPILLNLGIAHYRAGQFDKAIEIFPQFLQRVPDSLQARQLYGLSLAALGQDEAALTQLEPTLDAAAPDAAVLYTVGTAYLRLNKPGLRTILERLAAFPAGQAALHLLQGQAFLRDQDFEQALEELQTAEKLNAELPRLYFALGLAHHQLKHHQEARAAFEIEARRAPRDAATLYFLAASLAALGDLTAAQQHITASLKLDPQAAAANALQGKILFEQGKALAALKFVEASVKANPTEHEQRYLLARIYQQLGRKADAAREFATVQRLKAERLKTDRANTPKP